MATAISWWGTGTTRTVSDVAGFDTAYTASVDGDTISLNDGTYIPGIEKTISKRIRIKATNPKGAIWQGAASEPQTANAASPTHIVYGIKCRTSNIYVEDIEFRWFGVGVDLDLGSNVVVQKNRFTSCYDSGIICWNMIDPIMNMNEFGDAFLPNDSSAGTLTTNPIVDAQMDYGIGVWGSINPRVTNNYFQGTFNQSCSFKEGNRNPYAADNTFEGSALTALFFGQNDPANGPYSFSGLPIGRDIGTLTAERNVFRPIKKDRAGTPLTYMMNIGIRAWHTNGTHIIRNNVIEAAISGIHIDGKSSTGKAVQGTVAIEGNVLGGRWKSNAGVLTDIGQSGIRLYRGVTAPCTLFANKYIQQPGLTLNPDFNDGLVGPPVYTETSARVVPTTTDDYTLKTAAVALDPDLSFARNVDPFVPDSAKRYSIRQRGGVR